MTLFDVFGSVFIMAILGLCLAKAYVEKEEAAWKRIGFGVTATIIAMLILRGIWM